MCGIVGRMSIMSDGFNPNVRRVDRNLREMREFVIEAHGFVNRGEFAFKVLARLESIDRLISETITELVGIRLLK